MQIKEKEEIQVFPVFKNGLCYVFVKDDGVYQIMMTFRFHWI